MYLEELLPEFRKGAKIRRSNWPKDRCIKIDTSGEFTVDNNNKLYTIYTQELLADNWELYQEPIDWDYIIKNKCPCWFYNCKNDEKTFSFLKEYCPDWGLWFVDCRGHAWDNCRPVRRDEVTFYEDKGERK